MQKESLSPSTYLQENVLIEAQDSLIGSYRQQLIVS